MDNLLGLLETGATLGSGALSGLLGMPYGLYKGVTSGAYGTPLANRIAEEEARKFMERNTYIPRTQAGQENLQAAAGLLDKLKLPPVMPEISLLGQIPRQAYAAQAERAGMAAERALEPVVQRTLERGGKGAQLLQDLGRGSRVHLNYPQDEAMLIAQQRAALPIEQGGLGLPANNTAADRAAAMSAKDAVHFSRTGGDFEVLDSGKYAVAPFDAVGTHVGTPEAALDRFRNTVGTTDSIKGSTYPVQILGDKPLLNKDGLPWGEDDLNAFLRKEGGHNWSDINGGKLTYQDLNEKLRKKLFDEQGYTSIPYINDVEAKGQVSYIVPPENLRSRFAAFDPFRRNAAIAAAMGVAAPNLLAEETKEKKKKKNLLD